MPHSNKKLTNTIYIATSLNIQNTHILNNYLILRSLTHTRIDMSSTIASFYDEDVKAIIEHFMENNEVPIEGMETDLPDDNPALARNYRYESGKWIFKGLVNITDDPDNNDNSGMNDEVQNIQQTFDVTKPTDAAEILEAPGSTIDVPAVEAKKKKAAPRKAKAATTKNQETDHTATEATEPAAITTAAAPKARKMRGSSNDLNTVMNALNSARIDEAKAILAKYIEKHGAKPPKRTCKQGSGAVVIGEDGVEQQMEKKVKRASDYNKFVGEELTRLKAEHPTSTPKERMQWAMVNWRKYKEATKTADDA